MRNLRPAALRLFRPPQNRTPARPAPAAHPPAAGRTAAALLVFALIVQLAAAARPASAQPPDTALEFDGRKDGVKVHDQREDYRLRSYTYSFWIKLLSEPDGTWRQVFTKGRGVPGEKERGPSVFLRDDSTQLHWTHSTGDHRADLDSSPVPVRRWTHVAFVSDAGEGTISIYLNGKKDRSASASGLVDDLQSPELYIGNSPNHDGVRARISDFRIYARALSEELANDLYRQRPVESGLVGCWPFSEGRGRRALDVAGQQHGEFLGDPLWTPARTFAVDLVKQKEVSPGDTAVLGPVELHEPRGEVTYQWYYNDSPIDGAVESELVLEDVTPHDAGHYHVRADDDRDLTPVHSIRTHLEAGPFLIENAQQLDLIRDNPDSHFKLTSDIDLSGHRRGKGWEPLGNEDKQFTGSLDGSGHRIIGMTIDRAQSPLVGFIGVLGEGGVVKNLGLEGVSVKGGWDTGGLVGSNWGGEIIRCYVEGEVSGEGHVGGLVGFNRAVGTAVRDCYARVDVSGHISVGGLIGYNIRSDVERTYAAGRHGGAHWGGGLIGRNAIAEIKSSYYDSTLSGQSDRGRGTPRETGEMMQSASFEGWDFTDVWTIDEEKTYPRLRR